MRKILIALILACGATHAAHAQSTRSATSSVRVRSAPDLRARTIATLARGQAVSVRSCGPTWCTVDAGISAGYARRRYLTAREPHSLQRAIYREEGPGYTNSRGYHVRSPSFASSRPSGASARCSDGSYSFSQSRRGTCSHHGGVAVWY
jgi:uncharacterized protein YraI